MSKNWLPSSAEDEQQKAQRRRLLKDKSPGVHEVVAKLDAMRSAPSPDEAPEISPAANTQPRQQRIDPKSVSERPDPKVISEGYQPKAINEVAPIFTEQPQTTASQETQYDARLIEIARLWSKLSERDREELLLTAKMKVHLNSKGG